MEPLRYGVFQLGQHWLVSDDSGVKLEFPTRALATAALAAVIAVHRASDQRVMVTIEEEGGKLRTLLNPPYQLLLTPVANYDAWDMALGSGDTAAPASRGDDA